MLLLLPVAPARRVAGANNKRRGRASKRSAGCARRSKADPQPAGFLRVCEHFYYYYYYYYYGVARSFFKLRRACACLAACLLARANRKRKEAQCARVRIMVRGEAKEEEEEEEEDEEEEERGKFAHTHARRAHTGWLCSSGRFIGRSSGERENVQTGAASRAALCVRAARLSSAKEPLARAPFGAGRRAAS